MKNKAPYFIIGALLLIAVLLIFLILFYIPGNQNGTDSKRVYCTQDQRDVDVCATIYNPVCGSDGVTYGNSCVACSDGGVEYYTPGEC